MMEVRLQVGKVIPPHPGRLLERKKLINLLKQGEKKGIVYISAPAGYGKTTLLTSYVSKHKGNLGWLTIDEGDRNLYLFLHYLVGSIQRVIPGFGVEISRMITDGKSQNQDMIFNTVINELITIEKPMLLVLDDLHHIQDHPEISLFLHSLIINRLPHISLFIASRIDPSGRLSYALTKQAALFITERQLRFRRDEMQKLAHAIGYKRLPNSKVNLLNRQSRGWAIAVVNGLNAIASGKRRPFDRLDDYFEAVFSDIDKQARWYFLMASLLPHINQKLLDLIFPGEGKMVLKTLLSRGLFITRLSDQENYLLHPLFKSYLAERLKNADYRRYLRTKRCAGRHFLRSGHFALAMDLLLEGEAFNLVLT
ncbi:MAG TPA: hypothetical protein EYP58_02695, partial [bacterium (Candidatus Stahlbacteria)]|nr:hypothetical protein [Candidatus Stahlbacteria bacterium]